MDGQDKEFKVIDLTKIRDGREKAKRDEVNRKVVGGIGRNFTDISDQLRGLDRKGPVNIQQRGGIPIWKTK